MTIESAGEGREMRDGEGEVGEGAGDREGGGEGGGREGERGTELCRSTSDRKEYCVGTTVGRDDLEGGEEGYRVM